MAPDDTHRRGGTMARTATRLDSLDDHPRLTIMHRRDLSIELFAIVLMRRGRGQSVRARSSRTKVNVIWGRSCLANLGVGDKFSGMPMTTSRPAQIFISYSTRDGKEAAATLRRDLEAQGFAI